MFLYSHWLQLPINTRHKIAEEFGIIKKGSTHVQDNKIQSDGYLIQDIEEAITVKTLQLFLNVEETDLTLLWNELVWRIENPDEVRIPVAEFMAQMTPQIEEPMLLDITKGTLEPMPANVDAGVTVEVKKRGRPAKAK